MKRSLPDVFLTILVELDPPTILPYIVLIMRMRPKSVKMVNTFSPLDPSPWWLGDGQKKIYISSTLAKVMGVQSQKYQKMVQKCHISRQIWG